jgi:hypothetical protein
MANPKYTLILRDKESNPDLSWNAICKKHKVNLSAFRQWHVRWQRKQRAPAFSDEAPEATAKRGRFLHRTPDAKEVMVSVSLEQIAQRVLDGKDTIELRVPDLAANLRVDEQAALDMHIGRLARESAKPKSSR